MNRTDLQQLAKLRIKEAKVLLDNGCYEGAYYLAGYTIECALKASIARQTNRYDFPDKKLVNAIHTHNLTSLVEFAGLEAELRKNAQLNRLFEDNWKVVKDWSEAARYQSGISQKVAEDLYSAISDRRNGVLIWLKRYW